MTTDRDGLPDPRVVAFERLVAVIDRLRGEGGCPWDRDQDLESIAPLVLEEAYEVCDALIGGDRGAVADELGDLMMNVVLAARVAEDAGDFHLGDVSDRITDKLVRRHPHVFGDVKVEGVAGVLKNWEEIKRDERAASAADASALAGVPAALPALLRAERMGEKAARVGFEWSDVGGALAKLDEEVDELKRALGGGDKTAIQEEIGDALFSLVNVARHAKVDPEIALRRTADRFEERFRFVEAAAARPLKEMSADELDGLWRRAKTEATDRRASIPEHAPTEWRTTLRRLRRSRDLLLAAVRDLPEDVIAARPPAAVSQWSIGQVLEHLLLVEEGVVHSVPGAFLRAEREGRLTPFPSEGLADKPPRNRLYRPKGTIDAPDAVKPGGGRARAELIEGLARSREQLLSIVGDLARWNPRDVTVPHPIFGELDALQWFDFQAAHEAVHTGQIRRIRAAFTGG